jgi:hypothetical protein
LPYLLSASVLVLRVRCIANLLLLLLESLVRRRWHLTYAATRMVKAATPFGAAVVSEPTSSTMP